MIITSLQKLVIHLFRSFKMYSSHETKAELVKHFSSLKIQNGRVWQRK